MPENPLSLILEGARIRGNLLRGADGHGENIANYPSTHSLHATQRMELVAPALKGGQRGELGEALQEGLLGGGGALVEDGEQTAVETALRVEPLVHALAHHHLPLLLRLLGVDHLLQEERQLTHRAVTQQLGRHGRQLRHLRLLRVGVLDHHLQDAAHLQRAEHRVDQPQPVLRRGAMRGDAPHSARDVAHALQFRLQGLGELEELRLLEEARDSEYMARKVKDTNGCYVVPAFTGLGAPHWDQYARGTIVGLTRGCNKNHIIRATLDSLCYQVNDVLHAMEADSGIAMKALKVDGGACANNYLMQTMADISSLPVERPCCVETTALGAAYLAGLAVGYWQSTDEVVRNWSVDRTFLPDISAEERAKRIKGWNKAVRCAYHWALDEE